MSELLSMIDQHAFHLASTVLTIHLVVRFVVVDGIETIAKCREAKNVVNKSKKPIK